MREHIAEVDDTTVLGDSLRNSGEVADEPQERLADDLERPLDSAQRPAVLNKLLLRHLSQHRHNVLRGGDRILKDGLGITLHRAEQRHAAEIRGARGF